MISDWLIGYGIRVKYAIKCMSQGTNDLLDFLQAQSSVRSLTAQRTGNDSHVMGMCLEDKHAIREQWLLKLSYTKLVSCRAQEDRPIFLLNNGNKIYNPSAIKKHSMTYGIHKLKIWNCNFWMQYLTSATACNYTLDLTFGKCP